jgi:hypothetical protein
MDQGKVNKAKELQPVARSDPKARYSGVARAVNAYMIENTANLLRSFILQSLLWLLSSGELWDHSLRT